MLSSVGRAAPLQGVGREFETLSIHQTSARTSQDVDFARFFVARFWCFERFLIQRVTKRVTKHGRMFCFDCWLFPILANCRRLKCEVLRFLLFFASQFIRESD